MRKNRRTAFIPIFTVILAFIVFPALVGCGKNSAASAADSEKQQAKQIIREKEESAQMHAKTKKILIAYFSHSGNTREIAGQIREKTGGDIFEIKTAEPYPTDYDAVVAQAKEELGKNHRPPLASKVENMDDYDTVFIGFPNWWGTMPMAVFTFLESYDFSGKTLIPFCTHEGSRMGRSVTDIGALCPQAVLGESLDVRGSAVKNAGREVDGWLEKTGTAGTK